MSDDLYLADKPSGILTHSDGHTDGLTEYLNDIHSFDLKVVHRLDRDTTGALIFARNKPAAATWTARFTAQEIKKTYLFVTDHSSNQKELVCHKNIDGKAAETSFRQIESRDGFSLWQAEPKTGRTHQIRIHAAELGMPLLGDTQYGGTAFPKMLLHCERISHADFEHVSKRPLLMTELELLKRPQLARWLMAWDRRQRLFPHLATQTEQCLRLLDDKKHGFAIDKYADMIWFYAFRETPPTKTDLKDMQDYTDRIGAKRFEVRHMKNRGTNPHRENTEMQTWVAYENALKFSIRAEQGWSPGLFLDQRRNRQWTHENARDLRVLNLFCYTAGFSLAAALARAREVTSVDTSRATLDWAKDNFLLNELDPENYEFWAADARTFLKGALNRQRKFDLIVCDPPSFARNKKGVFRFEEEAEYLVKTCVACLSESGRLLFSCNFEKWSEGELFNHLTKWAPKCNVSPAPGKDLDYSESNTMKSFFISR